jgi:hypothetical protein
MTKVAITETYVAGCPACTAEMMKLCQWYTADAQVTAITLKAGPTCDHQTKPLHQPGANQAKGTLPPHQGPTLFAEAEMAPAPVVRTGYDEPGIAG